MNKTETLRGAVYSIFLKHQNKKFYYQVLRESDRNFVFWPALASSLYGETSTDLRNSEFKKLP